MIPLQYFQFFLGEGSGGGDLPSPDDIITVPLAIDAFADIDASLTVPFAVDSFATVNPALTVAT